MKYTAFALLAGFVLDMLFGDPRWLYHPVCVIGNLIAALEKRIRSIFPKSKKVSCGEARLRPRLYALHAA